MNWTEGKLARHSRARQSKQTVLHQKEHFAKARAGLLPDVSKQTPPPLFSSATSSRNRAAPTTATPHGEVDSSDVLERSSVGKKRRPSSSPRGHPDTLQQVSSRHFSAAPSKPHNPGLVSAEGLDEASIRAKRRKLLRDKDWAGIGIQKPIPVAFAQIQQGNKKWTRPQRSTAGRRRHLVDEQREQRRKVEQPRWKQDVRITVGSQEVRLGQGTSSRQSEYGPFAPPTVGPTYTGASLPGPVIVPSSIVTNTQERPKTHRRRREPQPSLTSASDFMKAQTVAKEKPGRRPSPFLAPLPMHPASAAVLSTDYDADSILAKLGAQASSNSSPGMEENDAWRVFVGPTQSDATHDESPWGQPKRPEQRRISPGVSTRHHALVPTATSQTESPNPFVTGTPERYQDSDSPKLRHMGSHLDQQMASANGPSVSYTISTSPRSDGTASYYSGQSRLASDVEVVEHSLGDDGSARRFDGGTGSSLGNAGDSPLKAFHGPPGDIDFAYDDTSGDTDSDTDSIDRRVADLRKAALNLVSRDAETPWDSRGKGNLRTTTQSSQCYTVDSNTSSGGTSQDVTHETGEDTFAEPPPESPPKYPPEYPPESPPEYFAQSLPESPQEVPPESPSESLPEYPTQFSAESFANVAQELLRLAGNPTESPQEISPEYPEEHLAAFPCEYPAKAAPETVTFAQTVAKVVRDTVTFARKVAKAVPETVTFAKPVAETAARTVADRPVDAVAQAGQKQSPTKETPSKESDDIWFKYLFSDNNTEELHNEVREKGAKEAAQALQQEAERDGLGKASGSDWGHNMLTAATRGQMSIGATESGDDLTSASAASASRIAAIGSPVATQTCGTVLDGREGTGGPPYAAPSMQCSSSSATTLAAVVQEDSHDSGSAGQGPSESITDRAQTDDPSSFSSKAVEPAQSVVEQAGAKEPFRFARPKLFVGKLSESIRAERPIVPVKPITMTKPKRGRSKKKALDGRANIRSIPVYRDDPIEDFQDSSPPTRTRTRTRARAEPSLFGALDTKQGDVQ